MNRPAKKIFVAIALAAIILGLLPTSAYAAELSEVVIGYSYTLDSGKTLDNDLIILGGSANLVSGSTVNGNIFLFGGSLAAAGTVNGDITIVGGSLNLDSTFILNGNINSAGASINKAEGARITGQINSNENSPIIIFPRLIRQTNQTNGANLFLRIAWFFLRLFLWVLVAMVLVMFVPKHLTRVAETAISQPIISGGLGLLTMIILPIVVLLLVITICLIPAAIILGFLLAMTWAFGLIALCIEVGKRLTAAIHQEWHPAITAGAGTLLVIFILNSLEAIAPCIGGIPKFLAGMLGLGAVLLTQFGSKAYISSARSTSGDSSDVIPA